MTARTFLPALAAACLVALGCDKTPTGPHLVPGTPSFITNGSLDGSAHPATVLILMDEKGVPSWLCTGTLIAPKVVLTAGHCAGEKGEFSGIRIYTESDVDNGNNNFPYAGPNSVEAATWQAHPQYTSAAFFVHDVGVITLKKAVNLPAEQYGKLPTVNQLDALKPSSSTGFTAVGYGLQRINPAHIQQDLIRMTAQPHLLQINTGFTGDFSLLLSNNASTGGTCFGDSGGPNYLGTSNVIAGVTSFGLNGTCGGTGGVFRLDRQNVLDFVRKFLN
ncbi:MAG TPA: trypsin-like serine protease [Gemmatimonadaceae bacterium]|nr:trypsin-like serine protease [Gemmatimonadaceae bacterium]